MGTADMAERELLQGLIKLAAAYVHAVRGNAAGIRKNLEGARARLEAAGDTGARFGIDARRIVSAIDARLARRTLRQASGARRRYLAKRF